MEDRFSRMLAIQRVTPERRLIAKDPVNRGWQSNGAAPISAVCDSRHTRRQSRPRATRRAAGTVFEVPGISRDSPKEAFRYARVGELWGSSAAVHNRTSIEETFNGRSGVVGPKILIYQGTKGGDLALYWMK